ncbi:sugar ABC transporter permease [Cohnella endophytica]|uniref:Sugar ABC transporter permease n=1 Tax=Cohnella endophytica TaxID=2419778 RepID=A0A494XQK2_9BACL|nr:sugar ABC transporter permease [Cohnella endophytica]RKP52920.1 sugar ABC transporter permease [Cohnella endophytica]
MKWKALAWNKSAVGYLFILPSVAVMTLFVIVPLLFSLLSSLYSFDIMLQNFKFIGLDNFHTVLDDDRFWNSLKNTVYFVCGNVPLQIVISILVAVAINKKSRLNIVFRTVYFLPVVCSMTIVAMAIQMMFDFNIGIVPALLREWGLPVVDVFNDPTWAMPAIILISVYKSFGFTMIILLAALQGVPESLYEAAEIDGAGRAATFFRITLPSIAPSIAFVVITSIIGSFQVFDQVYVTTKGGPMFKTETIVQYVYDKAFVTNEMGPAIASAILLFIIILIVTLANLRIGRKSEQNF